MYDTRRVPAVAPRVETGPVQFGDDWPGTFIRGDDAHGYAMALEHVLKAYAEGTKPYPIYMVQMGPLLDELRASRVFPKIPGEIKPTI